MKITKSQFHQVVGTLFCVGRKDLARKMVESSIEEEFVQVWTRMNKGLKETRYVHPDKDGNFNRPEGEGWEHTSNTSAKKRSRGPRPKRSSRVLYD